MQSPDRVRRDAREAPVSTAGSNQKAIPRKRGTTTVGLTRVEEVARPFGLASDGGHDTRHDEGLEVDEEGVHRFTGERSKSAPKTGEIPAEAETADETDTRGIPGFPRNDQGWTRAGSR